MASRPLSLLTVTVLSVLIRYSADACGHFGTPRAPFTAPVPSSRAAWLLPPALSLILSLDPFSSGVSSCRSQLLCLFLPCWVHQRFLSQSIAPPFSFPAVFISGRTVGLFGVLPACRVRDCFLCCLALGFSRSSAWFSALVGFALLSSLLLPPLRGCAGE